MPAFRSMMCHHETHEISTQKSTLRGQFGRSLCGLFGQVPFSIFEGKIMQPCGCSCLLLNHVLVVSYVPWKRRTMRELAKRASWSVGTWALARDSALPWSSALLRTWHGQIEDVETQLDFLCSWITGHHQHPWKHMYHVYQHNLHGFILGIWWWNIRLHVTCSGQTTQRLFNEPSPIVTSRLPPKIGKIMDFQESLQSLLQNFHQKTCCFTKLVFHLSMVASTGETRWSPSNLWPEIRTSGRTGLHLCSLFWRIGCTRPLCASWIVQVFRNWGGWMRSCIWWLGFQKRYEKRKMWWKIMIDFKLKQWISELWWRFGRISGMMVKR